MSTLSQKKDVFEEISILKTASELSLNAITQKNDIFSALESSKIKNNNDPFLFIVDLLTILAGSIAVNKIITEAFSALGKIEKSFKSSLKMEIQSANGGVNANPPIPINLVSGLQIHINKIDFHKELFTDDTSKSYNLYLDSFKQNLISIVKNPNVTMPVNSMINASYNNQTGFFTITPTNSSLNYNDFMSGLIDDVKFIDSKILYNQILDGIFNTQTKTKAQITTEAQLDTVLNNLMTQTEEDNSYYTFNTQALLDIDKKVATSDQLYTNVGSGTITVSLNVDDVDNISSGMTFPISSKVIENTLSATSNLLVNSTQSPNLQQNDKQSVSNSFLSQFLNSLKTQIVRNFIASPQINLIYAISQSFIPNTDNTFNPVQDIINRKALTKCMIKKLMNALLAALYKLVKTEILSIVGDVAAIYAQEGLDKFKKIIASII